MTTRQPTISDAINWEHALEFSYTSYHAEAIAYLCLFRSTALTVKAYFFDEGSNDQVVVPHNHRYSFDTKVIAGELTEVRYLEAHANGRPRSLTRWRYECIADGGKGFSYDGSDVLGESSATRYGINGSYRNWAHADIHTLRGVLPGTILLLTQYADKAPAHTFGWSNIPPDCQEVYEHMGRAEVQRRAEQLQEAMERCAA